MTQCLLVTGYRHVKGDLCFHPQDSPGRTAGLSLRRQVTIYQLTKHDTSEDLLIYTESLTNQQTPYGLKISFQVITLNSPVGELRNVRELRALTKQAVKF